MIQAVRAGKIKKGSQNQRFMSPLKHFDMLPSGERGIRTPGPFGSTVFKTAAFDRSAISPPQK